MTKLIITFSISFLFYGCRKEIPMDFLEANQNQVVIEAVIESLGSIRKVEITKVVKVSEKRYSGYPISGARVAMQNPNSNRTGLNFEETYPGNGNYEYDRSSFIDTRPGQVINLTVELNGKIYTATSKVPFYVHLDSVSVITSPLSFPGNTQKNYALIPRFLDPKGERNFYRFKIEGDPFIYLLNDNQSDGLVNSTPFLSFNQLYKGTVINVEMQCIDEATYNYFYQLNQNATLGQAGGPTPTNPPSNIQGGALGYFSTYYSSRLRVEIP